MARDGVQDRLFEYALDQFGLITAEDARSLDVDPVRLRQMLRRGVVTRVSRGVYRFALAPKHRLDQYAAATFWPRGTRGVLSHETALDLHDLCDVNPDRIDITVPRLHRVRSRDIPPAYRLHNRELLPGDQTYLEGLPIVTPVRAVLDAIDSHLRSGLVRQAIGTLRERGGLDAGGEERIYRRLFSEGSEAPR